MTTRKAGPDETAKDEAELDDATVARSKKFWYQKSIRFATVIVCQQAARNYFLRINGAAGKENTNEL